MRWGEYSPSSVPTCETSLTTRQLWDVCSDQEAVDLIRNVSDPQTASKALVEHALARFSTDNLSCMVIRFDNRAVQETVEKKTAPIGVEGDEGSKGTMTEAESIVATNKKPLEESGDSLDRIPSDLVEEPEPPEPGPELNTEALGLAKRGNKSDPPASLPSASS